MIPYKNKQDSYISQSNLDTNSWITPPSISDPKSLPEPLGWTLLVRPYGVIQNKAKSTLILPDAQMEMMSYLTNIARVVSIGPCCWTRPSHRTKEGKQFDWVSVGDFVSFPKNAGSRRKFKGVSFVLLVDDEVVEKLPDPQVFDDDFYKLDIPQEDLEKYNSIYKKDTN